MLRDTRPVANEADRRMASYLTMADALMDAMTRAVPSHVSDDHWRYSGYAQYMRKYNELATTVLSIEPADAPIDTYNLEHLPGLGDTPPMQQRAYFEDVRANLAILRAYLQNRVHPKAERIAGLADFFEANLRRATLHMPERETDVQDVVEQLLIGKGMEKGLDYDRESGRVKFSAKEVIPDFNLLQLSTAVEVKLLKSGTKVGPVIDQINADVVAYGKDYDVQVYVVYDCGGVISDVSEFRRDIEAADGVRVLVIKH